MAAEDASKLIQLPLWVALPLSILSVAAAIAPHVQELLTGLNKHDRALNREEKRLNILKLRYEIEAMKRENQLPDLPDEQQAMLLRAPAPAEPSTVSSRDGRRWRAFVAGALGAIIPGVIRAIHFQLSSDIFSFQIAFGFLLALVAQAIMGLVVVWVLRLEDIRTAFFGGLAATSVQSLIAEAFSNPSSSKGSATTIGFLISRFGLACAALTCRGCDSRDT